RPFRQSSIRMANGIVTVFTTLIDQPFRRAPAIFDETVTVAIPLLVDPAKSGLDIRPKLLDGVESAGALQIGAGQYDEEGRGIDTAVIAAKRHFTEFRHLAVPYF